MQGTKRARPQYRPWHPAPWEKSDALAIKALASGTASEGQQVQALKWIVETLCGAYQLPYIPDSDRDTSFAAGKMFVGQQIVKLVNMPGGLLEKEKHE